MDSSKYKKEKGIFYEIYPSDYDPKTLYMTWYGKYTFGYFWCRGAIMWFNPEYVRIWDCKTDEEITKGISYNQENKEFETNYYLDQDSIRFAEFDELYDELSLDNKWGYIHITKEQYERFLKRESKITDEEWYDFDALLCSENKLQMKTSTDVIIYDTNMPRLFMFDIEYSAVLQEIKEVENIQKNNNVTLYWV